MKESKEEKSKNKFLKGMSVFLAGLLAGLGIGHNAHKALPEGKENTEKPQEITGYEFENKNAFKESLKNLECEIPSSIKTERQILEENLQMQLDNIYTNEDLEKFIIEDIKQRYIEEYNKEYNTNYKESDITLRYAVQSYSYVKNGKFCGKEHKEGAKVYYDKLAYRIYNSSNNQLESILDTGIEKAYSSEDINILGKYVKALDALESISYNSKLSNNKKSYKEGILNAYDVANKQIQDNIRE